MKLISLRLLVGALSLWLTSQTLLPAADDVKPLRVLMVTGGCCHDYERQKLILSEGISARANVEWTIVHEGKTRTDRVSIYAKPDWSKGYDCVLHNECYGAIDDVPYVENIAKPHFAGMPAVMLHCSTHSYRAAKTDEWRKAIGQTSMSHEGARDLTIKVVDAKHPVMIGFPDGWIDPKDELYKNEKLWPNLVPLAQSFGVETKKDHVVVWTNTYGKGQIFGTTLGHANATVSDPVYLDLVARGLLWSCGKLAADGTPLPGYGPSKVKQ
ncbi:MAG TPA: ThuA domain-containing protein [Pirellulaceae bacterium]|nr:ThuA domain-containing protein [Pirellulaceae bacterium]